MDVSRGDQLRLGQLRLGQLRFGWSGATVPDGWRAWLRAHAVGTDPARTELAADVLDTAAGELAAAGLVARRVCWAGVPTLEVEPIPIDPELRLGDAVTLALAPGDDAGARLRELASRVLALQLASVPAPIFALHVTRERWAIAAGELDAELCLDRVDVRDVAGASLGVLGELVLERVRGAATNFAALGDAVAEQLAAESTDVSIVERARALAGLPGIEWPGRPAELEPDAPLGEAARALLRSLWSTAMAHEPGVRAGLDPEQVHKMRVAMRRLRTALRVFAGAFEGAPLGEWRNELRWLGRLLGEVRDLDVHRLALPSWRSQFPEAPHDGWEELDHRLAARRTIARATLIAALDGPRRRTLDELAARCLAARSPSSITVVAAMPRLVNEQVKRCRSTLSRLRERGTIELAHRLRIRVKNVRYTLEFLRETDPDRFTTHARVMSDVQEELGALQDAVQTGRLARELALAEPATSIGRHALGALVGFGVASEHAARAIATTVVDAIDLDARLRELEDD
jgi:CHAD domain-containing protein